MAAPDPAVPGQAVRQCPQCLHITWAYNDRCHHCGLDVRVFKKKRMKRMFKWGLLAAALVAWVGVMAADIDIVYTKPGAPPNLPDQKALEYAAHLRADLMLLESKASLSIMDRTKALEHRQALATKRSEAQRLIDMHGPLGACLKAAMSAADLYGERMQFAAATQPRRNTGLLVQAAKGYAENLLHCRTDIERYQALMKPTKR